MQKTLLCIASEPNVEALKPRSCLKVKPNLKAKSA